MVQENGWFGEKGKFKVTLQEQRDNLFYSLGLSHFSLQRSQSSTQVFEVSNCPFQQIFVVELGTKSGASRQTVDCKPNVGPWLCRPFIFQDRSYLLCSGTQCCSGWSSTWPQVSGLQNISHDVLMAGWYLGNSLLWKHCLQDVLKLKKKPYEFKMPVLICEHLLLYFLFWYSL